jgi:hypothetical protein
MSFFYYSILWNMTLAFQSLKFMAFLILVKIMPFQIWRFANVGHLEKLPVKNYRSGLLQTCNIYNR